MGSHAPEVRKLSLWLLDIIWEGLGLTPGYFRDELSQVQVVTHHYPPCPDPSLTLGLPKHCDPFLLTFLLQGEVKGLQVLKDGQWLAVEPLPNALVVNIDYTLQMLSNGKLRCAEHRVVTHRDVSRTTVCIFIHPSDDCQIGPLKELLSDCNPPLYRDIACGNFFSTYIQDTQQRVPPLERYKILH